MSSISAHRRLYSLRSASNSLLYSWRSVSFLMSGYKLQDERLEQVNHKLKGSRENWFKDVTVQSFYFLTHCLDCAFVPLAQFSHYAWVQPMWSGIAQRINYPLGQSGACTDCSLFHILLPKHQFEDSAHFFPDRVCKSLCFPELTEPHQRIEVCSWGSGATLQQSVLQIFNPPHRHRSSGPSPLPLLLVQLVARLSSCGVLRLVLGLVQLGVTPASLAPVGGGFAGAAARLLRGAGAGSSGVGDDLWWSAGGPLRVPAATEKKRVITKSSRVGRTEFSPVLTATKLL